MITVEELRRELVEKYNYDENTVSSMKKAELKEALELEGLKFVESDEDEELFSNEKESDNPVMGDPGWADYVMSLFKEDELYEGKYPMLKGLRRIGYILLNGVWESEVVSLTFTPDNRALCVYKLRTGDGRIIHGAADAHKENVQGMFSVYPVAIAENRAEARAYRKALMIDVVTAEEMSGSEKSYFGNMPILGEYSNANVPVSSGEYSDEEPASQNQLIVIESKCRQLGIDSSKFLSYVNYQEGKTTKKEAKEFLGVINKFQQNPNDIPEEIKS